LTLLLLLASACAPKFQLQALDPESIPAEVRDGVILPSFATGLTWRDYHEESGWSVAAYTYEITQAGRTLTGYEIGFFTPSEDGTLQGHGGGGSDIPDRAFTGSGSQGEAVTDDGSLRNHFDAWGIAFDTRATKVVGVTSAGRTVEGSVVNGFWGLLVANGKPKETWTSIKALSADGRVLFQYFDGKAWH
jgi:hypothetical protein